MKKLFYIPIIFLFSCVTKIYYIQPKQEFSPAQIDLIHGMIKEEQKNNMSLLQLPYIPVQPIYTGTIQLNPLSSQTYTRNLIFKNIQFGY